MSEMFERKSPEMGGISNSFMPNAPSPEQSRKIEKKLEKVMKKIEKSRPQVVEEPLDIIEEVNSIDFSCSSKSSGLRELTLNGGHPDHPETWNQNMKFSPPRNSIKTNPEEFNPNPIPK